MSESAPRSLLAPQGRMPAFPALALATLLHLAIFAAALVPRPCRLGSRSAWAGITGSDPFPALPAEFGGPYLALRFRFFYNPTKEEREGLE